MLQTAQLVGILRREGERLATAAARTSLDAVIPSCPGWNLRDLLRHVSGVHFWAMTIVSGARARPFDPFAELEGKWPPDDELVQWFADGHAALVTVLDSAPDDLECFAFLPASSPRAFWARRQAHETGMHRADAEAASGSITPFEAEQAVDGLEELLFGFMARPGQRLHSEAPKALALQATDADAQWLIHVGADEPTVTREHGDAADCRVSASASDLFLLAWNRRSPEGLRIEGDRSLLDLWRECVLIRWR